MYQVWYECKATASFPLSSLLVNTTENAVPTYNCTMCVAIKWQLLERLKRLKQISVRGSMHIFANYNYYLPRWSPSSFRNLFPATSCLLISDFVVGAFLWKWVAVSILHLLLVLFYLFTFFPHKMPKLVANSAIYHKRLRGGSRLRFSSLLIQANVAL